MLKSTYLNSGQRQQIKLGNNFSYWIQTILILLLSFSLNQAINAQAPCNAHRWNAGDGWRYVNGKWEAVTLSSPNLQPKGIIRCASSAETESGLTAYKGSYNSNIFPIDPNLTGCFNQQTGTRPVNVSGPTQGEDIVWFNFDIRPLAGTYQFQIISNQVVGWVLYYSKDFQPTTATGTTYPSTPTGLSGTCSNLQYADCGLSGNGWSTIKVPSFTKPTNYYLAMWIADPGTGVGKSTFPSSMNLTYKARYGCGGSTCFLEKSGSPELTCLSTAYKVCQTFNGSAGKWLVVDNATTKATSYSVTTYDQNGNVVTTETRSSYTDLITNPLYVELGTITGTSPQNDVKAVVCATYANGNSYNISLTPSGTPAGAPNDYVDCTSSESFSGSGLTALAPTATPDDPDCGQTNGSVAIDNYDATITYVLKQNNVVKYSNPSSTGVFSNVAPGTYVLEASKTGSCTGTGSVTVASPPSNLTTPTATPDNPDCGEANGSVQVDNFVAADGITYELKQGGTVKYTANTSGLFSNVAPGIYDLVASKSGSCSATGSVTVSNPPPNLTTPTATPDDPDCEQTVGSVQVNNFDATITYELKQNGSLKYTANSSGLFGSVTPGTYDLVASKTGSCTATGSVTVAAAPTVPDQPTVCVVQPSLCGPAKGIISITPVSGNTYSIDNGKTYSTKTVYCNLDAGLNPIIIVKSSDGCPSQPINCADITPCTTTPTCPVEEQITSISSISSREQSVNIKLESPKTKITAVPNPFYNKVKFSLESEISGQGSLELYNMLGQKIKTVYQGYVQKGQLYNLEYNVPEAYRSSLIYIFRVGEQRVTGKLLGLK